MDFITKTASPATSRVTKNVTLELAMPHTWRVARALLTPAGMKALLLVPLSFVFALSACESSSTTTQPTAAVKPVQLPAGFERVVDTSQVCMVNDQYMGKPQIPIAVEGRTYYGCCPMCKDRLASQPASRIGKDPVTGNDVDKAIALMVKDASGKILYFENEDSLRRYKL